MRALLPVALVPLLVGCSAAPPEPTPDPTTPAASVERASCDAATTAPSSGAAPVIDCIYPDEQSYVLCSRTNQRLPLELRWATVNADRVFLAAGEHDDAEPAAMGGALPPIGAFDADGELRFDCGQVSTTYTLTAKGDGGATTRVFSLVRRIP